MKKIEYNILTIVLCMLLCTNCSDVLDKNDLGSMSDKTVYDNAQFTLMVLDKLHRDIVPGWDAGNAEKCDEAGPDRTPKYPWGQASSDDFGSLEDPYKNIRRINMFLENLAAGSLNQETKDLYSAQALVMRAWIYFDLTRNYGGVPIVSTVWNLSDDLLTPRNKTSECIQFIVQDLDNAIAVENFPYSWSGVDAGRLSKAAALALKGRVLLYWASPQFNPDSDQSRWTAAYNANKEAKEKLEANGYGLYDDFYRLWFDEMNKEVIFVKRYQEPNLGHSWEAGTRQPTRSTGMDGWNKPTWQMAKAFPMITGEPISESTLYDDVFFWKNRDPRFTQTIAWNSCTWAQYENIEERLWTYPPEPCDNPSSTHLYCRKAINPASTEYQAYIGRNSADWIEIRFAETLMNYAECAAELGNNDEAYSVLKQIRARAGITAGASNMYGLKAGMSKAEMTRAIMLERQIEFAFENKRLWDLRRRRMLQELNGMRREGRLATLKMTEEEFAAYKNMETDFENQYDLYFTDVVDIAGEDRVNVLNFPENYYFYPLHSNDLVTNSKLEQTQGWDNGTFDPLQ
ncbi:MAG: RagB/SusD family nutrient uptake outer membrane protein [Tannerella sp.]|nr:RagB/SusD family nutrient uptake outer membrane protein [Tannerella sp.]